MRVPVDRECAATYIDFGDRTTQFLRQLAFSASAWLLGLICEDFLELLLFLLGEALATRNSGMIELRTLSLLQRLEHLHGGLVESLPVGLQHHGESGVVLVALDLLQHRHGVQVGLLGLRLLPHRHRILITLHGSHGLHTVLLLPGVHHV